MAISDNPIRAESQDLYGRVPFAANLAHLLLSFPADSSYCVGVYGDWGSGKTSVLEMAARRIRAERQHVVWLAPWALGSADKVLERLLDDLVQELGIKRGPIKWLSKAARILGGAAQAGEGIDIRITIALRTARPVLDGFARNLNLKHGEDLLRKVAEALAGKRVVVFVDDLDRTRSRDVTEILLTLREAMSLPGVHYVLALSPSIVREGLRDAHPEWNREPQDFLDKIVEYPLPLVAPTKVESLKAAHALVQGMPSFPNPQVLDDLIDYLPSNPRRLKLFLRLIDILSPQLERFSPEELDYKRVLLIQMLRVEFPSESLALFHDVGAVQEIESDFLKNIGHNPKRQEESGRARARAEETHAPEDSSRKERFLALCEGIRKRDLGSELGAADLFFLLDRPVLLTWQELDEMLEQVVIHGEVARAVAATFVEAGAGDERAQRLAVLWDRLVKGRDRVLGAAADRDSQEQLRDALKWAGGTDSLLTALVVELASFSDDGLGADAWSTLRDHVLRWHRFLNVAEYPALRQRERALLSDVSARLTPREQAIAWMRLQNAFSTKRADEPLQSLLESISESFSLVARDLALERFTEDEGIDIIWGSREATPERLVMFDLESPFHAPPSREQLGELANKAATEPTIQQNFLTYLRALLYGATESNTTFSKPGCQALCCDETFLGLLWRGAVSRPLNPRVVGSLREQLKKAAGVGIPLVSLTKPRWWTAMEETVFSDEAAGG